MKILMYLQNPSGLGGIERVARELTRIFAAHGAETRVFCDRGGPNAMPSAGPRREQAVEALVAAFRPDVAILHGVPHAGFEYDLAVFRRRGVPVVAICHFSFPSAMLLDGDERANDDFLARARRCDLVATVSAIDAQWWRALGCRALHVQNPFVPPGKNPEPSRRSREAGTTNLLWVGRNAEPKQPSAALAAFARAVRDAPGLRLTMVGGSDAGWAAIRAEARRLGLADKVTCLGERDDLSALWAEADVHLLTSVTESFCLVLAEAKAHGVPTAMFEIPFLELVADGRGIVTAPQGDVDGLGRALAGLASDAAKRRALGAEAKASLAAFNDEAVWASWQRVFAALASGEGGREKPDAAFATVVAQEFFAWHRFCEKNLWAVQLVRDAAKLTGGLVTLRALARLLRRAVTLAQSFKAWRRRKAVENA